MSEPAAVRVFGESEVREIATDDVALAAAERAFLALNDSKVTVPSALAWDFPRVHGEVHVKGAHLYDSDLFTFKVSTGFFSNVEFGVATGSGIVMVFDSGSGYPRGILMDNGYLTDLRTAAGVALATSHLTADGPLRVAVLGAGALARLQVRLLRSVRDIAGLTVWTRSHKRAESFQGAIFADVALEARVAGSPREAVAGADLVVTATPSRQPLLLREWLEPGVTVIAVGANHPGKQELDAQILADADKVVTDLTSQCVLFGELQHAVRAGLMTTDDVYAELGAVVAGDVAGRDGDELIVCDITGVGAQDAALAEAVFRELTRE
jgi:ornithine cyclodeaminase/alanine dehydrogenase-like protein (mu-crystallin family)